LSGSSGTACSGGSGDTRRPTSGSRSGSPRAGAPRCRRSAPGRHPRRRPPRGAAHSSDRFPCRRSRSRLRRRRSLAVTRVRMPAVAWPLRPG
jgi:hypothetical protein